MACLLLLAGCASEAERDKQSFEADRAAVAEVRRIQAGLARGQGPTQNDLETLKRTRAKYPAAEEVRQALQNALQQRQDWDALEKLLTEKPEGERTPGERVYLAKVYIKLGRYKESSAITAPMAEAAPGDLELNSLAGHAWYYLGDYERAARAFDRVWEPLVAARQVDEMQMRGMIHFFKGETDRAIEVLKKTVELQPDYIAGNNALSRVYAAKGDHAQAEAFRQRAEQAHARQTADEARRMRLTSRARDLEAAFAAGRYDECVQIAREMIASADEAQKPAFYEYLGQAYKASGRASEAEAAFQEAARLRQQQSKS